MFPKLGKGPWALSTQVGDRRRQYSEPRRLYTLSFCLEYTRDVYRDGYWTHRNFSPGDTMEQHRPLEIMEYLLPLGSNLALGIYCCRWLANSIISFWSVETNTVCSFSIDLLSLIYYRLNIFGKRLFKPWIEHEKLTIDQRMVLGLREKSWRLQNEEYWRHSNTSDWNCWNNRMATLWYR